MTDNYKWGALLIVLLLPFCAKPPVHKIEVSQGRISEAVRMDVLEAVIERRLMEMEADTPMTTRKAHTPKKRQDIDPIYWRDALPPE